MQLCILRNKISERPLHEILNSYSYAFQGLIVNINLNNYTVKLSPTVAGNNLAVYNKKQASLLKAEIYSYKRAGAWVQLSCPLWVLTGARMLSTPKLPIYSNRTSNI